MSASLQKPSISYLRAMTTNFGMMQHAKGSTPDPKHGYAVDDNARALLSVYMWRRCEDKGFGKDLEDRYLHLLRYSQDSSGKFYCYVTMEKEKEVVGAGDFLGRALMAASFAFRETKNPIAGSILEKSMPLLSATPFKLHTLSFLILAAYYSEDKKPWLPLLRSWAYQYKMALRSHQQPSWYWPEKKITYDNGKIIQAYLLLGELLESQEFIDIGVRMLEFYLGKVFTKDYLQIPGNKGFVTPTSFPLFDEQALEVYSLIAALTSASLITQDTSYTAIAQKAYQWFWGKNRLGISMVDPVSKGVYDGLLEKDASLNEGAESYLSLLLSFVLLKQPIQL